ncbi:hypothetical protein [Photobacterium kasasachensis]|uniref:hypothetical protein n=1 Tax=Photobacterium kasasachensis TaxID=2910240 RepID=UPI003D131A7C
MSKLNKVALTLGWGAVVFAGCGILYFGFSGSIEGKLDSQGCLPPELVSNSMAFVIDKTDPFSLRYGMSIKKNILREVERLQRGEPISVYVLTNKVDSNVSPIYKFCYPGKPSDNIASQSITKAKYEYKEKMAPFEVYLESLAKAESYHGSPILESMKGISYSKELNEGHHTTLHIYSDFRQYSHELGIKLVRKANSAQIHRFKVHATERLDNFSGRDVHMHFIPIKITNGTSPNVLRELWMDAFTDAGANADWSHLSSY